MDMTRAGLVVALTLIIVVAVNVVIYYMVAHDRSNKGTAGQIELFRRAARRVRDPWQDEDNALKELSQRVEELKHWTQDKKEGKQ